MKYDIAVIGGGPGGYTAAAEAAKEGMSVVLFEKDSLGGTCLNRGCMPAKALIHTAELYERMKTASFYGLQADRISYDMQTIHARKNETVAQLCKNVESMMKKSGVTVIKGEAHVPEKGRIECGGEIYEADDTIIAAGSVTTALPVTGADTDGVFTSNDILEGEAGLKDFKSLVIIGGGVIGVEFASFYRPLGCSVTIVEAADRILPEVDKEISQRLSMYFRKRGISVNAGTRVKSIEHDGDILTVVCENKKGEECRFSAEGVLAAAGRRSSVEGIFTGVFAPEMINGAIAADEEGRTSVPGLYVIGDAKYKNIQLAHMAEAQAKNVVAVIAGKKTPVDTSIVPVCIYASPEIAYVGLSEAEAKEKGISVKCAKSLTGANGKCLVENAESGYVKLVSSADTGKLLGAQLVCPRATDLVAELAAAIEHGMTVAELAAVIHPHPTFSEMIREAAEALL